MAPRAAANQTRSREIESQGRRAGSRPDGERHCHPDVQLSRNLRIHARGCAYTLCTDAFIARAHNSTNVFNQIIAASYVCHLESKVVVEMIKDLFYICAKLSKPG